MNYLIGLFLIAHGMVHASYLTPKPDDPNFPFDFTKGWFAGLVGPIATPIGIVLTIGVIVAFIMAGLGIMGVPVLVEATKVLMFIGALSSLAVLGLYWNSWLVVGVAIDLVILYGVLKLGWGA